MRGQKSRRESTLTAMMVVAMAVFGLATIVGICVWMISTQPGIQHSPGQSAIRAPYALARIQGAVSARAGISRH